MAAFKIPTKQLLNIVTPDRNLVCESVDEVVLPGSEGYLGSLPGHTPLLTSLRIGEIKYRVGAKWYHLCVSFGFVEVLPGSVTVLADAAEKPEEIDVERAEKDAEEARTRLKKPDADFREAQAALDQALVRLQVAAEAASEA